MYWHDQLTSDLQRAELTGNLACPVVYGGKDQAATVHVDDGLIGGLEIPVNNTVEILKDKYKLECSVPLKEVGDQVRFLKRTLEVIPEGLQIHIDPKYVEKVVSIWELCIPVWARFPRLTKSRRWTRHPSWKKLRHSSIVQR